MYLHQTALRVLRKIFGLKSLEVMERWGKVQGNELHNFDRARSMHGGDGNPHTA